jgi:hypothetical protein
VNRKSKTLVKRKDEEYVFRRTCQGEEKRSKFVRIGAIVVELQRPYKILQYFVRIGSAASSERGWSAQHVFKNEKLNRPTHTTSRR